MRSEELRDEFQTLVARYRITAISILFNCSDILLISSQDMETLAKKCGYRTALVTGASSGLGLAFARMLHAEGLQVWATSRDGTRIPAGAGYHAVALDLLSEASLLAGVAQVRREAGVPDVLVNNAGAGVFAAFARFPEQEIAKQFQLLLASPVALTRMFWPEMLARKRGAVVNVSSLAAEFPLPGFSLYSAAKAGLSGFSRALMIEAAGGVQVLDFQPGDYKTAFNRAAMRPPGGEQWEARVWTVFEQWVENGADPAQAARDLRHALAGGRSGTLPTGMWFQTRAALFAQWLGGRRLMRWGMRKVYRVDG
jgi:NAD(P)-dependent dehydrogenase (short-subunit alcohol dehydrogenase family)